MKKITLREATLEQIKNEIELNPHSFGIKMPATLDEILDEYMQHYDYCGDERSDEEIRESFEFPAEEELPFVEVEEKDGKYYVTVTRDHFDHPDEHFILTDEQLDRKIKVLTDEYIPMGYCLECPYK